MFLKHIITFPLGIIKTKGIPVFWLHLQTQIFMCTNIKTWKNYPQTTQLFKGIKPTTHTETVDLTTTAENMPSHFKQNILINQHVSRCYFCHNFIIRPYVHSLLSPNVISISHLLFLFPCRKDTSKRNHSCCFKLVTLLIVIIKARTNV